MIAPQPFYTARGTPINVRLLCEVLGKAGYKVDLLVFPTGEDVKLKNVRIIRVPNLFLVRHIPAGPSWRKFAFDLLTALISIFFVLTNRYDVIHGIEEGGFLAVVLGKLFRITSVYDMDSSIPDQLKYSGFLDKYLFLKCISALEKWSLENSSAIISVCDELSKRARSRAPESNIFQIEDIPIPDFGESKDDRVYKLIKAYQLTDTNRIVYTGNLQSYQGIDLLLDSWGILQNEVKRDSEKITLVIVGGPLDRVENYRKMAEAKGIQDSICWVGPQPLNEMSAWMDMSDVLVSPRVEGYNTPLKIYSYMSSGRPIVATRLRTHTQVLDDSMAFLAEPEPNQFARAISEALTDSALSKRKSRKATRVVQENYSSRMFSKKLLEAYSSIHSRL